MPREARQDGAEGGGGGARSGRERNLLCGRVDKNREQKSTDMGGMEKENGAGSLGKVSMVARMVSKCRLQAEGKVGRGEIYI